MKKLLLAIQKEEYRFILSINPFLELEQEKFQKRENDLVSEIFFLSRHKHLITIKYKNIIFQSYGISQNKWNIQNTDRKKIIMKDYNNIYFFNTFENNIFNSYIEKKESIEENDFEEEEFQELYNLVLHKYETLYKNIKNKNHFIEDLKLYIYENGYFEYSDESDIIGLCDLEYEDGTNCIDKLLIECKQLFDCFISSEIDQENLDSILTLDSIVEYEPELKKIRKEELEEIFYNWKSKYLLNYEIVDINYNREEMLNSVATDLLTIYKRNLRRKFEENFDNYLYQLLGDNINKIDKSYMISDRILRELNGDNIPSDELIIQTAYKYIDKVEQFEKRYSEIVDNFGANKFLLKINNKIIDKYKKYEQGLITLNDREYKIYDLVYKYVVEKCKICCCIKNTTKLKPTIAKFDDYIMYVKSIFKILIENNYLIEKDGILTVNEKGDYNIENMCKLIGKLEKSTS